MATHSCGNETMVLRGPQAFPTLRLSKTWQGSLSSGNRRNPDQEAATRSIAREVMQVSTPDSRCVEERGMATHSCGNETMVLRGPQAFLYVSPGLFLRTPVGRAMLESRVQGLSATL